MSPFLPIALNATVLGAGVLWMRRQANRVTVDRATEYRSLFQLEPLPPAGAEVKILVEEDDGGTERTVVAGILEPYQRGQCGRFYSRLWVVPLAGFPSGWGCLTMLDRLLSDLFRRHHRDLVRFTTRLVGDRDSGEEIAQEAYLRIAGRGATAAAIVFPKTYLFTAARNSAVDFTARRRLEWSRRVDLAEVAEQASSDDPFETCHRRDRLARIVVALNELPSACRRTFVMNRIDGMSHREIAAALGISVSMVEKHMMRALGRCRDLLREDLEA